MSRPKTRKRGQTRPRGRLQKGPELYAVNKADFEEVLRTMHERGIILDEIRHALDLQFKRFADMQADLDALKRALDQLRRD